MCALDHAQVRGCAGVRVRSGVCVGIGLRSPWGARRSVGRVRVCGRAGAWRSMSRVRVYGLAGVRVRGCVGVGVRLVRGKRG